jgi:hypothetical protein
VISVDDSRMRIEVEQSLRQWRDSRHHFEFDHEPGRVEEFVRVRWGARSYLLPPWQMIELGNAYNSGRSTYRLPFLGGGHHPEEVWERPGGDPVVPAEYRDLLLPVPATAQVTAVGE